MVQIRILHRKTLDICHHGNDRAGDRRKINNQNQGVMLHSVGVSLANSAYKILISSEPACGGGGGTV